MTTTTLHYIHDPLCGWCYGAAPLVKAAREVVAVVPHAGGMMTGARRQTVTPQLRDYVKPHDAQIAERSGQPFGEAYTDGLLRDTGAVFDSVPPTAAMLAAEMLAGRGLDMLAQLQIAHYVEGRRIADRAVLIDVAAALGFAPGAFAEALDSQAGKAVITHIDATRQFMSKVGAQGFPTFVLQSDDRMERIDITPCMGKPRAFQDWLRTRTARQPVFAETVTPGCLAGACAV